MSRFKPTAEQLQTLNAIPDHQLKRPSMPVAHYLQEANNLSVWISDDREKLLGAGLPPEIFDRLQEGFELLKYFEVNSKKQRNQPTAAMNLFQAKLREGQQLQLTLARDFRYAFRHHPALAAKAREMVRKSPQAALFQALNNLALLGEDQLALLLKINFNPEKLERARQLSDELPELRAAVSASPKELKDMRDRAFLFLKATVDELYECGRYVFRDEPSRLKGYYSCYMQKKAFRQKHALVKK